jgi:hypothetical protein
MTEIVTMIKYCTLAMTMTETLIVTITVIQCQRIVNLEYVGDSGSDI